MNTKGFFKCSNCGKTDFENTQLGIILATEGHFLVNSYACTNCGHIEIFKPEYDAFAEQLRCEQEERKQIELQERQQKEAKRQEKIQRLQAIINDENSTVKQVRLAQEQLKKLNNTRI